MQRRLTLIGIAAVAALFVSCLARPPQVVAPEEVLRRAIINTATLDNVDIEAEITAQRLADPPLRLQAALTGTLLPLTHAWMVHLDATVESGLTMDAKATAVSSRPGELFLRIEKLSGLPEVSVPTGIWMMLSSGSGLRIPSPDPRMIEAYASAFEIRRSELRKESDGTYGYHMSVALGTGGLLGAESGGNITGELTIDARTFRLQRADWTLLAQPSAAGPFDVHADVRFLRQNSRYVSIPVQTGSFVSPESIFDMISLQ